MGTSGELGLFERQFVVLRIIDQGLRIVEDPQQLTLLGVPGLYLDDQTALTTTALFNKPHGVQRLGR